MCTLCENMIYTKEELNYWLNESSYNDNMPRNIIFKDMLCNYLYSSVDDHTYNRDTAILINYCPKCGKELM